MNIQNRINLSFVKKLWWLFLLLSILEFTVIIYLLANPPKIETKIIKNIENEITKSKAPECPDELSGILTYPFIRPQDISAITPLGNINPPGHTSPVDHNYFETDVLDEIPLYAPADSTITNMIELAYKESEEDESIDTDEEADEVARKYIGSDDEDDDSADGHDEDDPADAHDEGHDSGDGDHDSGAHGEGGDHGDSGGEAH